MAVCDVVRAMLVVKDMATIARIARAFRHLARKRVVGILRIKDRIIYPSAGGWRDVMINLVILGCDSTMEHVCEVQVRGWEGVTGSVCLMQSN